MIKRIKNKKGDVPITILVLGVFLICTITLGSFFIFQNRVTRNFAGIGAIEKMNLMIEKYNFYRNLGEFKDKEIDDLLEIKMDSIGKYLYVENLDKSVTVKYYLP